MNSAFGITQKPVGFFWDIENCPVPKDKLASGVIHHLRNFFVIGRLNSSERDFLIACDVSKMKKGLDEDINRSGNVTLAHVSGSSKNAADEKLRESMKRFVDTHGTFSPTIVLISGDIDFVNDLRAYQTRMGCHIVLIHGNMVSPQFKQGWNEMYAFKDFCNAVPTVTAAPPAGSGPATGGKGPVKAPYNGPLSRPQERNERDPQPGKKFENGPARGQQNPQKKRGGGSGPGPSQGAQKPPFAQNKPPGNENPRNRNQSGQSQGQRKPEDRSQQQQQQQQKPQKPDKPQDQPQKKSSIILMVCGLPGKVDYKILKENLQKEATTVGGKVCYVNNGQGFIAFRTEEQAGRAICLFHGKEVYGKKLSVTFAPGWVSPVEKKQKDQSQQQQQQNANKQSVGDTPFVMVPHQQNATPQNFPGSRSPGFGPSSSNISPADMAMAAAIVELARANISGGNQQQNQSSGKGKAKSSNKESECCVQ